jgi:hypothetical protein
LHSAVRFTSPRDDQTYTSNKRDAGENVSDSLVGLRGSVVLEDSTELRAHLAALQRLENVGVLLGSGASAVAGGHTMRGVWADFLDAASNSAQYLQEQGFIPESALDGCDEQLTPNFERLGDAIDIALLEWKRQGDTESSRLALARADLHRAVVRAALLQPGWWDTSAAIDLDSGPLEHHRSLLQKLVAARQPGQSAPWVFTTNYDLAIEWAAESIDLQVANGFVGLHGRRFSPQSFDIGYRNTQTRGEARFGVYNIYLAKLHGSLSWHEAAGQVYELPAPLAWQHIQRFLEDDGATELGLMVMPRAAKYMETIGFVLGELFRRFAEYLARPQASLLVSGYGFGDEHINRLLKGALLNPTLQLVVYFPGFDGDPAAPTLPAALRNLLALRNPRVTVIGGGEAAYLDQLVEHLPDPLLYDAEMRRLYRELQDIPKDGANAGQPVMS